MGGEIQYLNILLEHPPRQDMIRVHAMREEVTKKSTGVSRKEIKRVFGSMSPRKKRTRPEPRQYTLTDLERARDRVEAAQRRVDNDRTNNPNRGLAGWGRAGPDRNAMEHNVAQGA